MEKLFSASGEVFLSFVKSSAYVDGKLFLVQVMLPQIFTYELRSFQLSVTSRP